LKQRLTRRGVALTAVLAAVGVGADAALAAVPRSVVASTVKAAAQAAAGQALAAGTVPAQVITLVEGVNQAMFVAKGRTVLLVLLSTAILGAGLGLAVLHGARAEAPPGAPQTSRVPETEQAPQQQPQPADTPAGTQDLAFAGRAVDADGKP